MEKNTFIQKLKNKQMTKKLKNLKEKALLAAEKAEEASKLVELAEQEFKDKIESIKQDINKLAESEELFCGIILGHSDLIAILEMALKTGESVKISFNLYPKDPLENNNNN